MDDHDSPLAGTEVHHLRSTHVGDDFKIFVGHCGTAGRSGYGVLYLTDANGYFGATVDLVRSLQLVRHLPRLLVVGIGYPVGDLGETIVRSTRDLTPTTDAAYMELQPTETPTGGAGALLAFVRDELMPWVESRYDVDPVDATYFGHSLGGLFGTHVLFEEPSIFRRYIVGSPSLWWDDRVALRHEARYAESHDDLAATAYFAIGADETQDGRIRQAANLPEDERARATAWYLDMVDDLERFVEQLRGRGYPSLDLRCDVFPDEFHVTVPLLVLSRGLRYVYEAPR